MELGRGMGLIAAVLATLAVTPPALGTDAPRQGFGSVQAARPAGTQGTPPTRAQVGRQGTAHVAISLGEGRTIDADEAETPLTPNVQREALQQARPRVENPTAGAPPRAGQRRRPSAPPPDTRARPRREAPSSATPQDEAPASTPRALGTDAQGRRSTVQQARPARALTTAPDFDRSTFETSLHGSLRDTVKGYSFVLMRNGQVVSEGADGFARNAADGNLPMTPATPVNIGSLFKFVAGVSFLHAMEQPPAGSAASGTDVDASLDAPLRLLLPAFWTGEIASPQVSQLTIRRYLQHRTGLVGGTEDILREFRKTPQPPRRGGPARSYQNINFGLIGYALGGFVKPSLVSQINQDANRSADNPHDMIFSERALGYEMDTYIRSAVMSKVPGGAVPSCDAANEFEATGAYAYRSRLDQNPGIITSRRAEGKPCSGAGGYWMSARHLAAFASAALHGDRLLSAEAQGLMYGANEEPDDRLIWSSATARTWTRDNFDEPYVVWSDGHQPYGGGQVSGGVLLRLPDNHVLVILRNSFEGTTSQLQEFGYAAFIAGKTPYLD